MRAESRRIRLELGSFCDMLANFGWICPTHGRICSNNIGAAQIGGSRHSLLALVNADPRLVSRAVGRAAFAAILPDKQARLRYAVVYKACPTSQPHVECLRAGAGTWSSCWIVASHLGRCTDGCRARMAGWRRRSSMAFGPSGEASGWVQLAENSLLGAARMQAGLMAMTSAVPFVVTAVEMGACRVGVGRGSAP